MGLTVSIFIPDAIVISTDSLSDIKHQDDGFYQRGIDKIFPIGNRFVLVWEGNAFIDGLPFSYFVRPIFNSISIESHKTVEDIAGQVLERLRELMPNEDLMGYVAGYDNVENRKIPIVALIHNQQISVINKSQSGEPVFNYHCIGRTHWVNKLLLPSKLILGDDIIEAQSFDIDFSKYSTLMAVEFSQYLLTMSQKQDEFSQLKPMIGGPLQTVVISPYEGIRINNGLHNQLLSR